MQGILRNILWLTITIPSEVVAHVGSIVDFIAENDKTENLAKFNLVLIDLIVPRNKDRNFKP